MYAVGCRVNEPKQVSQIILDDGSSACVYRTGMSPGTDSNSHTIIQCPYEGTKDCAFVIDMTARQYGEKCHGINGEPFFIGTPEKYSKLVKSIGRLDFTTST